MNKVIVNNGSRVNLYGLIEDLQTATETNIRDVFRSTIMSYGFNVSFSGQTALSNDLKAYHDGTALLVNPGNVITSGMVYITVPTLQRISLDSVLGGDHLLYLKHRYFYERAVDTVSGYIKTLGLPDRGANSYATDSFEFVWDVNPGASGILIADVITRDGLDVTVHDRRNEHILKFFPEQYTHEQNTNTYTSEPAFYIGGSPGDAGAGRAMVTPVLMPPNNFRITNILSAKTSDAIVPLSAQELAYGVQKGLATYEVSAVLNWNWDDVRIGGRDGLSVDEVWLYLREGKTVVTQSELVGYRFTHATGVEYTITTNDATQAGPIDALRRTKVGMTPYVYGVTTSIGSLPATTGRIHSGADEYEIVATPLVNLAAVDRERYVNSVLGDAHQSIRADFYLGESISFKIRARYGETKSGYTQMSAGRFTKEAPYLSPVEYGSPVLMVPPQIDGRGAGFSFTPGISAFTIDIQGWEGAQHFDLVYSKDDPDYNAELATRAVFAERTYTVATPTSEYSKWYNVKVRPLHSGFQVGQIISGKAQTLGFHQDPVFYYKYIPFDLVTWRAHYDYLSAGQYLLRLVDSPAFSGKANITLLRLALMNGITYFPNDGTPYKLASVVPAAGANRENVVTVTFRSVDANTGANPVPGIGSGTLEFNNSERGRQLLKANLFQGSFVDYKISSIKLDVTTADDGVDGNQGEEPITVRAYPWGSVSEADYTRWTYADSGYFKPVDVPILPAVNAPTGEVVVSLYDPQNTTTNRTSISGTVIIEYTQSKDTIILPPIIEGKKPVYTDTTQPVNQDYIIDVGE